MPRARAAEAGPRHAHFDEWLRALEKHVPPTDDAELDGYYRRALMGVTQAFGDRNLSPYLPEHTALIAPLLADIRAVYERLKAAGAPYSRQEFTARAFDYGIHKSYYLDWQLYLSKELY